MKALKALGCKKFLTRESVVMGKKVHYGKPSSYPYYFRAERGRADIFISGTFKTKKAAKTAAQTYAPKAKPPYKIRLIDRRK
jgi:hypothetical protein